ncbi:LrgB family protein [Clostridium tyrobutyricum]|uniref:LrgB family protein n=1 Tax=Clostridium tyrobutyricum TaxID=1519 RepID=UPI001C3907A7|nr:LrgB family protein [Clostridium tyrobutyricum]MBV4420063.1 LrgB family protein [Clostridium tyrobutyricum]
MRQLITTPLFSIMISLFTFEIGTILYNKTKIPILNPLLISQTLIIIFLLRFHISFNTYNQGGQYITFFLTPATVILAVPIYKKLRLLKENALPIFVGISIGSVCGIVSTLILSRLFGLSKVIMDSMVAKSITTPIGIEISKQVGGIPAVTVAAIVLTGIIGSIIGPIIFKLLKINDRVAKGIALGTSSHAVGTAKAIEMGEVEGSMSGLSIGIAGIITVIIAPIIVKCIGPIIGG